MKISFVNAVYGSHEVSIDSAAVDFDMSADFLEKKIGVRTIHRLAGGEDTSDLAVSAATPLLDDAGIGPAEVGALVLCTQNGDDEGLPQTSSIVHRKLSLARHIPCLDISLGCSGFVYAVQVADALAESLRLDNVLVITSDPYSKIIDARDRDTALLFSDGASATLLTRGDGFSVGSVAFSTLGERSSCLVRRNGKLVMNGREVYNSVIDTAPRDIVGILEREQVAKEDVDRFLFHQGSRFIVDSLRKRMKLRQDQVPVAMEHGNTVSSTIPALLADALDSDAGRMIMSGFGVGFSAASMFLRR